jgi:two-component system, chemotaxis family, chemotaxis protein CheY
MMGPDETARMEGASGLGEPKHGAILIVEDDEGTRESLRDILEGEGFDVAEAGHGQDALALLGGGLRPSLIFLDLMMPVMNGFDFLEVLRRDAESSATPVVVVSAWPDQAAKVHGVQGFLKKPFALEEMFQFARRYAVRGKPPS